MPFDLTAQYNMRGGLENDRLRFGTRWRVEATPLLGEVLKAISLTYSITFHLLQIDHVTDNYVWQIEHIFRLDTPWLDRRLYIGGFIDHSINEKIPGVHATPAVVEIQTGLRLIDELHAICELRANEYREPTNNEVNVALGAEYVIKW